MAIPVVCACSAKLNVGDHLRGKHVKCPKCGAVLPVGTARGAKLAAVAPARPSTAQVLAESNLSDAERQRLDDALEKGERLVWAEKPAAGVAFLRGWLVGVGFFFGAVVCAVILGMLVAHGMVGDGPMGILVAALPGVAAAGFLVVGLAWPFLARRRARRTVYAFTDRRALAWACPLLGKVRLETYHPSELAGVQHVPLTGGADAVGNLIFSARAVTRQTKHGREITGAIRLYGFFYVRRAADVERRMREELIDPFTDKLYE